MTSRELIRLYGRRFTPLSRVLAFIAILISGVLIVFGQGCCDSASGTYIEVGNEKDYAFFCAERGAKLKLGGKKTVLNYEND